MIIKKVNNIYGLLCFIFSLLALIFFWNFVAGLFFGIISITLYILNKNTKYKKLAKAGLIISIIALLSLALILCIANLG